MPYIGNQHNVGDHVNNFKVLDDISSHTATFDGSASGVVDTTNNTIRVPLHRFIQGQRVTYTNGGGGNILGLTTGTAYFVSFDSANTIKLATTLANANSNTVINLSAVGTGTSHTLNAAFDGVNTKFKLTHSSGKAARLNNATQINVAINNVIQRPNQNALSFSEGFALEDNHKIVFKTAPTVNDIFWGSIIANTIENFDLRDNEVDNFTGDGSTTEFTLSTIPANNESVVVTIDGALQHPSDKNTSRAYTLIDSIIQFTSAPALSAEIQVRHIGFAGASTNDVSGFYGRTGNVSLTSSDNITINDIPTVRNINASGIITATTFDGAFTGNVVGTSATFTGNVSVGGVLTYEDVTNVDSVGIITAQKDVHVGAGVSAVGVGTFGSLDIGGDIDVDGHTNLDNVSIAGVTTFSEDIIVNGLTIGKGASSGGQNTVLGENAFDNTGNGGQNVAIGKDAFTQNQGGSGGVAVGFGALFSNTSGHSNTAIGRDALRTNTTQAGNTAVGRAALYFNTAENNTALGQNSLFNVGIGKSNTAVGQSAGNNLTSGGNNLILGYNAQASANNVSNEITLGNSLMNHLRVPGIGVSFSEGGAVISGIVTATTFKGDGDFVELDVDGHTNLDNVSVGGATTMSGNLRIQNATPTIYLTDTDNNPDYSININGGHFEVRDVTNNSSRLQILSGGTVRSFGNFIAAKDLDVDGHTNLDNVSIAGIVTAQQIRYSGGGNTYNGHPRSVVIGYSGSNYANLGMGWVPTSTNGQYTSANSDYQSRLELYDGLQIYGSGASVTSGQTVSWINVADFKPSAIKLYTSGDSNAEKLRITSDGKVVAGGTGAGYPSRLQSHGAGNLLDLNSTSGAAVIRFYESGSGRFDLRTNNGSSGLNFYDSLNGVERLSINSAGNIGINNTNPQEKLQIAGNITLGNRIDGTSRYIGKGTNGSGGVIGDASSNGNSCWIGFISGTSTGDEDEIRFGTHKSGNSGGERMRIDGLGRITVGESLGTHNDASELFKIQKNAASAVLSIIGSNDTHSTLALGDEDDFNRTRLRADHTNDKLQFYVADTERLILQNGGVLSQRVGSNARLSHGILEITTGSTPSQIKITTNLPYSGASSHAESVTIRGFRYGGRDAVDIQICWHVYAGQFYNRIASSSGGWAPLITLGVENNKVVIHMDSLGYWPKIYVADYYSSYNNESYARGWSWSDAAISGDSGTPVNTVPYKNDWGGLEYNSDNAVGTNPDRHLKIVNGDLQIGTSGHGIDFSATSNGSGASGINETLDDYEFGDFTPTMYSNTNKNSTTGENHTHTGAGQYVKVGKLVTVTVDFNNLHGNANNHVLRFITGLPFTSRSNNRTTAAIGYQRGLHFIYSTSSETTNMHHLYGHIGGSSTTISLNASKGSSPYSGWPATHNNSGTSQYLRITISYFVD